MIAASLIGIFVIPPLYVIFQWLRERLQAVTPEAKSYWIAGHCGPCKRRVNARRATLKRPTVDVRGRDKIDAAEASMAAHGPWGT